MTRTTAPAAPITVTVQRSSHPEFDLFASATVRGRQVAARGDRARIDAWMSALTAAATAHGFVIEIDDATTDEEN